MVAVITSYAVVTVMNGVGYVHRIVRNIYTLKVVERSGYGSRQQARSKSDVTTTVLARFSGLCVF